MENTSGQGQRAGGNGGGFFSRHPLAACAIVLLLLYILIPGWLCVYLLFVAAAIALSAGIAYIACRAVSRMTGSKSGRDADAASDGTAGHHGAAVGNGVTGIDRRRIPASLLALVDEGFSDAADVAADCTNVLDTADEVGANGDAIAARYEVTLDSMAKIISTYHDMKRHPADFDDFEDIERKYRNQLKDLHRHMSDEVHALNRRKIDAMYEDMNAMEATAPDLGVGEDGDRRKS